MGLYDTITFKCPNCGEEINAQSKSGNCSFRHAPFKCKCGKSWAFDTNIIPEAVQVNLPIIEIKD